jgi:hypothetical protein
MCDVISDRIVKSERVASAASFNGFASWTRAPHRQSPSPNTITNKDRSHAEADDPTFLPNTSQAAYSNKNPKSKIILPSKKVGKPLPK